MSVNILQPEMYRIMSKKREAENSFTFELQSLEQKPVKFSPGQFNMLYAFGIGEVPISFSGDPTIQNSIVHTIKAVGKVTQALSRMEEGELMGVRGPFGNSWPITKLRNKDLIIIAGGIGLAPLRPLIYYLLHHRKEFGKISILYGARDPLDLIFYDELETWSKEFDDQVMITVDFADESWSGHVGVVTNLISEIPFSLKDSVALLCGPELMLRFTIRELLQKNIAMKDIYLSMERNMKCAIGHCGRCQYVQNFLCKDGPVFSYSRVEPFFNKKEV